MSTDGQPVKRLTPEEIQDQIHRLAREGDGADARWALKMLSAETAGSALPEPLSLGEIEDRGSRVLRGMGQEMARRCFYTAFRNAPSLTYQPVRTTSDKLAKWGHLNFPTTLKKFNKMFPEHKRAGMPSGYPRGKSDTMKREFLMKLTVKCMEEREGQQNDKIAQTEAVIVPPEIGTDATHQGIAQDPSV